MKKKQTNPFQFKSPEDIEAKDVIDLFVPVFNDFPKVPLPENTFINGPRGSGKTMMFRFMMPDCQSLDSKKPVKDLDYFAIFVPIKKTEFNKTEFDRLKDHTKFLLNEHILTSHIAVLCLQSFISADFQKNSSNRKALSDFYHDEFQRRLKIVGWREDLPELSQNYSLNEIFALMQRVCEDMYFSCMTYCNNQLGIIIEDEIPRYQGPICTYLNFLYPILIKICLLNFMPNNPIYLLIDDADNLNKTQTRILNSWISYRSGTKISFKVSTQMNSYKTFRTMAGPTIDTPHDYGDVNIATVYTSSKGKYKENVKRIVAKRLEKVGIEPDAYKFFPEYKKQKLRIDEIYNAYVERAKKGEGRVHDDAYRYSRPDYIKELSGPAKQKSSYFYAGFEQLVHLSSGIVRFFLEAAARMFGEMEKKETKNTISFIDPGVQNDVSREFANEYLFNEFDKIKKDLEDEGINVSNAHKLRNLIDALGGVFSAILLSNASERRVFSIALSSTPDEELQEILDLGVRFGYFQESSIGNKEGTGRTKLYIMNRRLAPFYTLDPTSFAGYKFMTYENLKLGILKPSRLIDKIKQRLEVDADEDLAVNKQLEIFD